MKKLLALILTLCMVMGLLPVGVIAADETATETVTESASEDTAELLWEYELYGDGVALTKYLGSSTDVYVPSKIEVDGISYTVIKLGDSLFEDNDALNSATLGDGITEIGARAFYDADNLVCIVTNEQLTTIGAEAFYSCDSFNSIILYDAVVSIGTDAFSQCPELTVWCNEGTAGYNYAVENSIPYEILNPDATPETYVQDGITYYAMNGEAIAIDFDESTTEVTVPATVEGYPVTELRETFRSCTKITSVTVSEGVRSIGDYAFYGCWAITEVNLPDGVTYIGDYALSCCNVLTRISIPNSVTKIGKEAFSFDGKLTQIVIPDNVTEIGINALASCRELTSVKLPKGMTAIPYGMFQSCKALTELVIPDGVNKIDGYAFGHCDKLTSVIIPDSVISILNSAFTNCASLVEIVLPNGLTSLEYGVFSNCSSLQRITIPESVVSINSAALPSSVLLVVFENSYAHSYAVANNYPYVFYGDTTETTEIILDGITYEILNGQAFAIDFDESRTEITVPATVNGCTVSLRQCFRECVNLKKVTLSDGITEISDYAFYGCTSLTEIIIPDSVTVIGEYALSCCKALTKIELPDNLSSIGKEAFSYDWALNEIVIPDKVTEIGINTFAYCSALVSAELSEIMTSIPSGMFKGCKALKAIIIPNGVTKIDGYAFSFCDLLESVVIPESVTTIASSAFCNCYSLKEIALPNGITSLEYDVFNNCTSLKKLVIPQSVTSINTTSLPATAVLIVYENSYAHTFAVNNNYLYFIYDGVSEPDIIKVDGITYVLFGDKAIAIDYDETNTVVTVPATIEGYPVVLRQTFRNCTKITSVTLSKGIKEIGDYTFYGCWALTNVNIPDGITKIGAYALSSCNVLNKVTIPDSVTEIGNEAFSFSIALTHITIPANVSNIGINVFAYCSSLTKVAFLNGITNIGYGMFQGCSSLTSVNIPGSVTDIGESAFRGCTNLNDFALPVKLVNIGRRAFENCTSLTEVRVPQGLTVLSDGVFTGCTSLQKAMIPETVISIEANTFPTNTILMVYEGSYAHTFAVENDLLYFIIRKTENPEISFGTGLSGTVTYTDGAPAAGANVEIIYDDGVSKETVVTDENGAYEFTYAEVGAYTIRATDAEGNTFTTPVSVKRMNAFDVFVEGDTALTLKKGYKVSGTVSVGGATVTVTDGDANVITSATADGNGNFVIKNLPNGTYIFTATTEQGSASAEVTVYNGDVSDITLTIATDTVTLWGYVEVEDRDFKHHRRNWVEITVYNEEGIAVAQCKSDGDGKYTFKGLPTGEYSIVAETAEMRKDKKHGFDRSFTLTGYAYVSALTTGEYELETIVLYEENDYTATISGKVTANGQVNNSEVRLVNVFRHEVAKMTTGSNGKYSFKNVKDGLYYIIATTEKDGMGMTVVAVRHGEVHGNTDIKIHKSDKIKNREDRFRNDIPDFEDKDGIHDYRERIADEKRFYDGLSEKEKKQLSRDYVERLNKYCEWLANTEYTSGDDVTVEGGGLILSGDELAGEDTVSFNLNVEKKEAHNASTDGVHDRDDHIHHKMNDTAGKNDIVQYYEITMSKTVDGEEKAITSVYKDTDATGKFRITITIPEEYRGHAQYTMLHEHHGEVVTLADLDDDPNTITVEVDRFSTFALVTSDESNIGEVGADLGDANADGVINLIDMTVTAQYIAQGGVSGSYDLSDCDLDAMDANADGVIDQLDLNAIAAIIRTNA